MPFKESLIPIPAPPTPTKDGSRRGFLQFSQGAPPSAAPKSPLPFLNGDDFRLKQRLKGSQSVSPGSPTPVLGAAPVMNPAARYCSPAPGNIFARETVCETLASRTGFLIDPFKAITDTAHATVQRSESNDPRGFRAVEPGTWR